jgi:uncharacterized protein
VLYNAILEICEIMLIRFGCSNFKSIYKYQEIILTASALNDEQTDLVKVNGFKKDLLPSIAIYGANASGKTNFIDAISYAIKLILRSYKYEKGDKIYRNTFKLHTAAARKPSAFDLDFIFDNTHYHYGFKINNKVIVEEWLYEYSIKSRESRKVLFHRSPKEKSEYYFGKSLKGRNKFLSEITNSNNLFFSTAAHSKHPLLSKIFEYFKSSYNFRFSDSIRDSIIAEDYRRLGNRKQVIEFLQHLDTGVNEIKIVKERITKEQAEFKLKFTNFLKENILNKSKETKNLEFPECDDEMKLFHRNNKGEYVTFGFEDESLGTQAVIALLIPVFQTLKDGGVLVVDEIESSLHALLTIKIVSLYNSIKTNPKGSQLLFSTHDTNLLCNSVLRRDQIWLSEKSMDGDTIISPLTDFSLRKEFNLQAGYLEGRFGAIPFFGDLNKLFY